MSFLPISMLLLMACCFTKPVGCQQLFSVQVLSPRMVNNVTIRCEDESSGTPVTDDGLMFYRNGVNQLVDRCLSAGEKLEDGKFMLQVSPSCEGHYMCGTNNSGGAKLSGPRELYAFPQHVQGSNTKNRIFKRFGDDANLPCSVERSALGRFRVEWKRNVNGALETVSIPSSDEDYSITLTNITFQDAGIYFCTVTSLELQGLDLRLNGFNVELLVNQRHIPPEFTGPAIYEQDRREFMVTVEGSAGLMVQWFINGQQLNSSSTQLPNNVVQSRLSVAQLMGNSRIIVIASNIDEMTGERFRTRTTILTLIDSQPASNSSNVNSCPGATPGVIAPVVVLCAVLSALLLVAGLAILILLKRSSKQIDPETPPCNPISHIFTNVGMFLQQSGHKDLDILEGLSQAVGTILNKENLTLTDKALECMENVKSSLEATKTEIRRNRREINRCPSDKAPSVVVLQQTDPPTSKFMPKGIRKASSNPDSGIESVEGSTEDSLEEVDGAYEEIKDNEIQKVDDLHEAVTQWLKKCRVLKRQNAITVTETFVTEV